MATGFCCPARWHAATGAEARDQSPPIPTLDTGGLNVHEILRPHCLAERGW